MIPSVVMADLKAMTEEYLKESLRDPDIVGRSRDFQEGYAQGFKEMFAAFIALEAKRNGTPR